MPLLNADLHGHRLTCVFWSRKSCFVLINTKRTKYFIEYTVPIKNGYSLFVCNDIKREVALYPRRLLKFQNRGQYVYYLYLLAHYGENWIILLNLCKLRAQTIKTGSKVHILLVYCVGIYRFWRVKFGSFCVKFRFVSFFGKKQYYIHCVLLVNIQLCMY